MRRLVRLLVGLVVVVALLLLVVRVFFGGGARLEDRTTDPAIPASAIEQVAALDYPPGNIAVSATGRVFLTLHPDGKPPIKVVELVDGKPVPFPDEAFQKPPAARRTSRSPLSMRIDRQNRLWVLDLRRLRRGASRASSPSTSRPGQLVHQYDFPAEVAGFLSMLNDFAVSPDGTRIYIAESSPIKQTPGARSSTTSSTQTSRRLLDRHPSVLPKNYVMNAAGRDMIVLGIYTLRIGVDSIALDRARRVALLRARERRPHVPRRDGGPRRRGARPRRAGGARSRTTARRRSATASAPTTPATSTSPTPSTPPS